ncbi:MAG: 30S ribosomal protein S9 [Sedimentisphaerales bacterium]|nr:30S ribosomal protein S9 [Sedimentisphaerales bacterium]
MGPKEYCWGTGRRKTSIARVRVRPGTGNIVVNNRSLEAFFPRPQDQQGVKAPLTATDSLERFDVFIKVHGGGISGQAGAAKLGLARALAIADPATFSALRDARMLTRDGRMKERKKYGRKKARKSFQFSKR